MRRIPGEAVRLPAGLAINNPAAVVEPGEYINPSHIGGLEEGQAPGRKGGGSISGHPSEWGNINAIIPATLRVPRWVPLAKNRGVSRMVKLRRKGGVSINGHPSEWGNLFYIYVP